MKNTLKAKRIKGIIIKILIIVLSFLFFWWLYSIYNEIEVADNSNLKTEIEAQRTVLTVEEAEKTSKTVSDTIEQANKAVVGISKIKNMGRSVFSNNSSSNLGIGTGFIVSENGYIVTNAHVSGEKYSSCYVTLENGKVYTGIVQWSDTNLDLSIVKINMKNLDYVKLGNSSNVKIGETVYAIGNPVGYEFQRTVTSGIISAIDRTIKFTENDQEIYMADLIQTDATINPGNSGGPLIKPDGSVIAINSVKITTAEGIGFAVPINVIKPIIEKYAVEGEFEEASIGIFAYDKNVIAYLDETLNIETGIYVEDITKGSASDQAGLKKGDIITKIDEKNLSKMNDLREYIYSKKPNDEVTLTVQRNRNISEIKLKLGKK